MAKGSPFATFLIIGPTCFFLGVLFASFPYDYYVLWSTPSSTTPAPPFPTIATAAAARATDAAVSALIQLREPYIALLEHHVRMLHGSPPLISRMLHMVIGTGLIGLLTKLYKPSEANMLFDGASMVLYVVGVAIYITNMVKGMRVITHSNYGTFGHDLLSSKYADENDRIAAEAAAEGTIAETLDREDTLKVYAASNTILALVLMGVLVLQAGQWYAQKKEAAEIEEMDRAADARKKEREKNGAAGAAGATAGAVKSEGDKKKQ